jgi:hypothetical protein
MRERASAVLLVATLAATAIAYGGLVSAYFSSDDFVHLYAVVDADLWEYLLRPHGGHLLMVRNAFFVAFYHLFGMRAELYFWAVLLTHLLNAFLLFRIVSNWTGSAALATLGALLWATCPTHAGTLAWYSVYGQVLVGTCLLIILHQISRRDRDQTNLPSAIIVVWPLLFIIASTCFGVGIGLTLTSPLALYLLLPPSRLRLAVCVILALIAIATPSAYKAMVLYHESILTTGSVKDSWAMAVAIGSLHYWDKIVLMFGALLSCGVSSMLLGFAGPAAGFPSIPATIAIVVYTLVAALGLVLAPRRMRLRMLGLLVFAVGCYAVIAAGRATLLPTTRVGIAAATTRYHYVGMMPLSLLLCCALAQLTRSPRYGGVSQYGLLALTVVFGSACYVRAKPYIDTHLPARKEAQEVVAAIRAAIDAAAPGTEVQIEFLTAFLTTAPCTRVTGHCFARSHPESGQRCG